VTEARRSPLHGAHASAGGRFIEFAGWRLPVHYGSILEEARAVRSNAGMFDVSHMARVRMRGPDAFDVLQNLGTNDLRKVTPGKAQYTLWCTPDGGTIDDLMVMWLAPEEFLVVVNASRREDDLDHLEDHLSGRDVTMLDETDVSAMIAVQGPDAVATIAKLGGSTPKRFGVERGTIAGVGAILSRTGYTGEDGIEIVCEAGAGPRIWEALREEGVVPAGLGARDALRMEMGYPLYGHELSLDISPLEAGVSFAVSLDDRDFIGRDALAKQASEGPSRKLMGFVCEKPAVPLQGDEVGPGTVTSGGTSVVLNKPIGLAFVPMQTSPGPVTLRTRGREISSELRPVPLIERKRPKTK
jgi:glycine cleavage system T protein (aminomethyltransferase)